MKPAILITGEAGFIDAHTTRSLKLAGEENIAIDSFSNHYSAELNSLRVFIGKDARTSLEVGINKVIKWAQDPKVSSLLPSWTETTV
jgi:UDP-glucose 4-epimerase